jgi:DNA polymerase-1
MLQSDVDYHILTAANMFGIDPKEVSKEQRDMGKTQNFAIIYGQSDYAMSRSLGKTLEETAEFRRMYEAQFPDLVGYVKMCNEQVKTQGYVETEFGNRRRFPFIPDFKTLKAFQREAGNSPIQGTAVYICCSAAVKLHKMFDPAETRVLFTVHDQIVGESRADVAEEHFKVVTDVMEHPDLEDRGVPWKAEGEIKDRWANALKGQ